MTPDEIERHSLEIWRLEARWAVCDACPGVDECPGHGWRPVLRRTDMGIYEYLQHCPVGQAHARQQQLERLIASSRMTRRFRERTFANFTRRPGTEAGLAAATRFAREGGRGVVFVGPVGSGKTHLAAAIANELLARLVAVVIAPVPDMLAELRAAMRDDRQDAVMDALRDADVLILDDIGAERTTDWVREQLYRLVNYRYEQELPIVATSNLAPDELEACLGDRIVSRLLEMCDWVLVDAADYRKRSLGEEASSNG